ncbi:MAG: sulfite exporter TauE/SafE family protein [Candidatus Rokuibacteriota bacterium]
MTVPLGVTLLALGFFGAFVSGLLGVGGAVVMIPLLLYVPPLLDVGRLDVKAVAGVTMTLVLVAAASGMLAHRRHGAVNAELVRVGGLAMAGGSLAGALASKLVSDRALLAVFALMVTAAAFLVFVGAGRDAAAVNPAQVRFSRRRAALVAGVVGVVAGLVGAGGAFLLVPLLLVVVGVPLRVTIGSSLAIVALAASAGFLGKLVTAQIPLLPTLAVVLGAVPGAQLGAAVSRRVPPLGLRVALFVCVVVIALKVWWDLLSR